MQEPYSSQALPPREYLETLGAAICVFNSNVGFVIENILTNDANGTYTWHELIDQTSGDLLHPIKETITRKSNTRIATMFGELVAQRNRIVHSFQITNEHGEQALQTKDRHHKQYEITKILMLEFIKKNGKLSQMLYDFRG